MAKSKAREVGPFDDHHDDPLLSLTEAGALIGRSHQTVSRWTNEGLLRFVRDPSGLKRVRKSDLAAFYSHTALAEARPMVCSKVGRSRNDKAT